MKLSAQDWQKLKAPLLTLFGVLVGMALLIGFAHYYSEQQQKALENQKNQLNAARQHYLSSGSEKDIITEYLPKYQKLINKGFVGEERRIEWVDELRSEHQQHKLFGIKYNISQQEEYKPTFTLNFGGFALHRSVMKLELDMLHEGDILKLMESMAAKDAAPFMLRDCEIVRLNNSTTFNQLIPNLHAQCNVDWLTIHEPVSSSLIQVP
ncbi:MAG: hypothetical protein H0W85_04265 [Methylotenera sp.]|nr:hypothetical protein [Methylotenera sp.]